MQVTLPAICQLKSSNYQQNTLAPCRMTKNESIILFKFSVNLITVPWRARGHTGGIALWLPGREPTGRGCHR